MLLGVLIDIKIGLVHGRKKQSQKIVTKNGRKK